MCLKHAIQLYTSYFCNHHVMSPCLQFFKRHVILEKQSKNNTHKRANIGVHNTCSIRQECQRVLHFGIHKCFVILIDTDVHLLNVQIFCYKACHTTDACVQDIFRYKTTFIPRPAKYRVMDGVRNFEPRVCMFLLDQGYFTPHGAVIGENGVMIEWWLTGQNWWTRRRTCSSAISSATNLTWSYPRIEPGSPR
jgi:hypothetical protein